MTLPIEDGKELANPPSCDALDYRAFARFFPDPIWIGGTPWKKVGPILSPLAMPHVPISVNRAELREALRSRGASVARWTTEWDSGPSEWWWVCCDKPDYDLDTIESSRARRAIRSGLRDCTIRVVSAGEFANVAYPIFRTALDGYGMSPPTDTEYAETIRRMALYPGTEFWGAFVGATLAAFATCQVIDGAVTLGSTKSDPEQHKHNANSALFYSIAQHYMRRGMRYVSNGSRTLYHPTTINEFLERMGFRKVFCRLNVQVTRGARVLHRLGVARWAKSLGAARVFPQQWLKLDGFDRLMKISESFG